MMCKLNYRCKCSGVPLLKCKHLITCMSKRGHCTQLWPKTWIQPTCSHVLVCLVSSGVYLTVIYKYKHTSHLSRCQVSSVMSKVETKWVIVYLCGMWFPWKRPAGWDGNIASHDDSRSILRNRNSHKLDKHAVWSGGNGVLDRDSLIFEHGHCQDFVISYRRNTLSSRISRCGHMCHAMVSCVTVFSL